MSEKKERNMSPRGFLHKAEQAKSAIALIAAQRTWLESGELCHVTSPILAKIDAGELLPTPGLEHIKQAVTCCVMQAAIRKGEEASARLQSGAESSKPYAGVIYSAPGVIAIKLNEKKEEVELKENFDSPQAAERWVNRRLDDGESGWFGEVIWKNIILKSGLPMITRVERNLAIAAVQTKKKSAYHKTLKVGAGPLGPRMKVSQTRSSFSRG